MVADEHKWQGQHLQQGPFLHERFAQGAPWPPEVGDDLLPTGGGHIMNGVHLQHKLWQQAVLGHTLDQHLQLR